MKIGYARVSTTDQDMSLQIDALTDAGCETIYKETASGKKTNRPEWEQCKRTIRDGDVLIVWRLDRLGRSLKDLIEILQDLQNRSIEMISLTELIDTTSPSGKLICHIFAALAEYERSLIQERTIAGLAAARARGRIGGRKPKLSADDVRRATAMLLDPRMTKTEVAAHCGVSRTTLNKALAASASRMKTKGQRS